MGFFSELKDDLSQAVNTILPTEEGENDPLLAAAEAAEPQEPSVEPVLGSADDPVPDPAAEIGVVIDAESAGDRTIEEVFNKAKELEAESAEEALGDVDLDSMLSRIDQLDADSILGDGAAEAASEKTEEGAQEDNTPPWRNLPEDDEQAEAAGDTAQEALPAEEIPADLTAADAADDVFNEAIAAAMSPLADAEEAVGEAVQETADADDASVENALSGMLSPSQEGDAENNYDKKAKKQEERKMEQQMHMTAPTDENAVITAGMQIDGDVTTSGSLDVIGKINGNVTANGKLNVTGSLEGNLTAAEVYAENARITGEVRSSGAAKIGQSTVIIGNIYANSAVVAGAVKGDIDVHGPVVLDTTAIVMGNIKSQSVQINNGAVIEGMCSQVYAEVNPQAFFDGLDR